MHISWHRLEFESKQNFYEVCSIGGLVRSVNKNDGSILILKNIKRGRYQRVDINGTRHSVHILVANTCHEKPYDYDDTWTVDHIDPEQTDNNDASNLRWASLEMQKYNRRKMSRTDLSSCPCIATKNDISLEFSSFEKAAECLPGVFASNISKCLLGELRTTGGYRWSLPEEIPDLAEEKWVSMFRGKKIEMLISNRGRTGYKFKNGYFKKISSFDKMTERDILENDGYPRIRINGTSHYLHRLIYETFKGKIPEGMLVHHKDHIKFNADIDNLELVSSSDNTIFAYDAGRYDGTRNERVPLLINGIEYATALEAAKKMNTTVGTIHGRVKSNNFSQYIRKITVR
jgi:hypothetical protein